ncbi:hypothetical protein FOCC_FOCC006073 [Frankliniella occidentalis]|nr:hypothetical protein FOCC_FOCC006073 [Frankliniella occidentalis]
MIFAVILANPFEVLFLIRHPASITAIKICSTWAGFEHKGTPNTFRYVWKYVMDYAVLLILNNQIT